MKDLILWDKETWYEDLVPKDIQTKSGIKKDLTYKVEITPLFNNLKGPLDFNKVAELVGNKYSSSKVPVALLKSLGEYHNKSSEEVNLVDMAEMYFSIKRIFGDKIEKDYIFDKWKKLNGLSFFGFAQYELMRKHIESNFPIRENGF
jgi:hypothetical protein